MDLPTVPLVTEGAEAEVLLSGWLEMLDGYGGRIKEDFFGTMTHIGI